MDELIQQHAADQRITLGIDTEMIHIHQGGQAIEVKSLSLDEKRRRQNWRSVIVYCVSVVVLVVLFILLLQQLGSGD